jgi:hypothetical protein
VAPDPGCDREPGCSCRRGGPGSGAGMGEGGGVQEITPEQAVRMGLEASPRVRAAESEAAAARARHREARGGLLPVLAAQGGYTRLGGDLPDDLEFTIPGLDQTFSILPIERDRYTTELSFEQPLFTGGRSAEHRSGGGARGLGSGADGGPGPGGRGPGDPECLLDASRRHGGPGGRGRGRGSHGGARPTHAQAVRRRVGPQKRAPGGSDPPLRGGPGAGGGGERGEGGPPGAEPAPGASRRR